MPAEKAAEEAPKAADQTREMMDLLRSQGRVQTSEILQFSEGLNTITRLAEENTNLEITIHRAEKKLGKKLQDVVNELAAARNEDERKNLFKTNGELLKPGVRYIENEGKLEQEKAELGEKYGDAIDQCLNTIDTMFRKSNKVKKNAAPWNSQGAEGTVDALQTAADFVKKHDQKIINKLKTAQDATADQEEKDIYQHGIDQLNEVKLWSQRTERDATYMSGLTEVSVGQSASLRFYWDVIRQSMILDDDYRVLITADGLANMTQADMPGLDFDETQKTVINTAGIGLEIPAAEYGKKGAEEPLVKEGETIGLKELATRFHDDSFESRMKAAAFSQAELDKDDETARKTTFLGEKFSREDFLFYKKVFTLDVKKDDGSTEFKILAPHILSKAKDLKLADARLEAILVTNATRRIEAIRESTTLNQVEKDKAVTELATQVLKEAKDRLKVWKNRDTKDVVNRMAVLVNKQGFLQDFSFMHAYRYCWQYTWKYVNEDTGKGFSVRKLKLDAVEIAGVLSRSGDLASLYFYRRALDYDRTGKSRTQWMLPSSFDARAEAEFMAYDKMPLVFKPMMKDGKVVKGSDGLPIFEINFKGNAGYTEEKAATKENVDVIDDFAVYQLAFLFSSQMAEDRAELGYQDFQEEIASKLMGWAVRWRLPFTTQFLKNQDDTGHFPADEGDMELVIPLFFPGLDVANFFEAITDKSEKMNVGKSVWAEMVENMDKLGKDKKRLSGVQFDVSDKGDNPTFNQIEDTPVDKWLIDMRMAANYMNILINVFDKDRDSFYNLVTGSPSTLGPKDILKKLVLTYRDAAGAFSEEYEMALIPFFITQTVADKYGLMSAGAWQLPADPKDPTGPTKVEAFLTEMATWKRAFKWMPRDRTSPRFLSYKSYYIDKNGNPIPVEKEKDYSASETTPILGRFALEKDGKTIKKDKKGKDKRLKWNYGNSLALMAEFYEANLLRMGKSSAEESFYSIKQNYVNTVNRINSNNRYDFMRKGQLAKKLDPKFKITG